MSKPALRRLLFTLPPIALLAGCAVGPDFKAPRPDVPATWSASASAAGVTTARADAAAAWWTSFNDAELTSLVSRARAANLDARQAMLRIAEARAQREIAGSAQWPRLTANASAQDNRLSESTPTGGLFSKIGQFPGLKGVSIPNPYSQYQLGFDASWEIDLFGRVRRSVEAAKADTRASIEDSRAVMVSTLGEVGRAYVDLRGAQAKRAVLEESVITAADLAALAGQRNAAGLSSDIDLSQAQAQAKLAEAQIPLLDRQITQDINRLSLLLALQPGALRAELDAAAPVPPAPPSAPIGLPGDLARRRPDIGAAEARLHAATARMGVAVADLYPRVTLGVQGGFQSEEASSLTDWASRFFSAGPQVQLPIFDGGQRRGAVRLADIHAQEAALDYRRTVLDALHEVGNALAACAADQSRDALLAATVARNRDALDLSRQRYASGLASFIEVLDAERTLQQNQLSLADATTAVSTDLIGLYKALGGGWS
ncbi:efflux transporter outer membrane subunit [Phenylobacterium montanum]|uniref:Efflux transporter outer membrane subunit n=1 Tax=Phenylobacterium montanum TaxID=2823693 RepID=A0A975IWN4_9CAUL|nr:efflux transporter outer membrane subunit [Caulobacter sp. S6]QUD89774.1 efflux transporter outer membrane subunit [Caulobacter sp. S6]